jgi:D-sedoheptulose 7-phosphate isomerase
MDSASTVLKRNLLESISAKQQFLEKYDQLEVFEHAVSEVIEQYRKGGRLYIAGNGGSAADAQHIAAEFVSKLRRERAPLPAEALTVDTSILTAIGNDYGYELIFSRQIWGKMTTKDIFLAITTSGNSPNILKALETCREMRIPTIVFSGHDGGAASALADYCITASGSATATIQEVHIVIAHSLCECVEGAIFDDRSFLP